MEIKGAQIKYLKKSGFYSMDNENVRHTKVLPYLSVVQSVEGSYDISLGADRTYQTTEGGFFIAPSNLRQTIVHHVNKESGKMSARWIFIDVEINRSFSLDQLYQFPVVINDERGNDLNTLFDRIFKTDDIWQNYSDCYALVGLLLRSATPLPDGLHRGIQDAVAYIKGNYMSEITVGMLANTAKMSESNFYSVFKKQMGVPPISYLNNYRLSIAADKLTDTARRIGEISYSVGINDPLYFSKLFKKTYGMTPKEYRAAYRG